MSNINLLPWRDDFKKKKKHAFFVILIITSIVVLALSYAGKMYVDELIGAQNERNQFLQTQTIILDRRIAEINKIKKEKAELESRINVIQKLEEKRNSATRLFNTLVDVVPAGIYLKSASFANEQVDVKGMSESNNRLAKMMRNIDGSGWLGDSYISSIVAGPSKPIKLSNFAMKFVVVPETKGEK
ncbi:PilN domain-containing protein [Psychromonas ossibalaenae]|uniref:PilN domain-containing protein n=1 Tax=Psychromonas ossibalaenae TaxID=444922 RepID=UPI00036E1970|nr:PilN domain-containing protein [Psychromonas ossibalaenae]